MLVSRSIASIRWASARSGTAFRAFSTGAPPLLTISTPPDTPSVRILRLDSPPVNILTREVISELHGALRQLRDDRGVDAVVLGSRQRVFCAGLNLNEILEPQTAQGLREYLLSAQELFITLYGFQKPVVAAINGAAPAAGCWLSLMADYRVGLAPVDNIDLKAPGGDLTHASRVGHGAVIGLNAVHLGFPPPWWFTVPMVEAVGAHKASRLLQLGRLLPPHAAEAAGLLDTTRPSAAEVDAAAVAVAAELGRVTLSARAGVKLQLRGPALDRMRAALGTGPGSEAARFAADIMDPAAQAVLRAYVAVIKNKQAQKGERKPPAA